MNSPKDLSLVEPSIDPKTRKIAIGSVRGHNTGGARTDIHVRHFDVIATDEPTSMGGKNTAPSPLEMVLASLIGCEGAIIHGVAAAMKFKYKGVDFDASGQIDLHGPKGVPGIQPHFEKVELLIKLHTEEPPERVEKLKANVENRCPVMNLLRVANVVVAVAWETVSP